MDDECSRKPPAVPALSDDPVVIDLRDQCGAAMLEMTRQGEHWYTVVYGLVMAYGQILRNECIESDTFEVGARVRESLRISADVFNVWEKCLESIDWPSGEKYPNEEDFLSQPIDWDAESKTELSESRWLSFAAQLIQMGERRDQIARAFLDTAIEMLICDSNLDRQGNFWTRGILLSMAEYFRELCEELASIENRAKELLRNGADAPVLQ